jgi:methylated-DNA-[protein]-cysteine S-methyltransferase
MNAIAMPVLEMADSAVSVTRVDSPLGALHVAAVGTGVCAMVFDDHRDALALRLRRMLGPFFRIQPGDPLGVGRTLHAYFAGTLDALAGIPLATVATPMQRLGWSLVSVVPAGSVTTYAALAERLGMPRAQRAVGVCLATNAVPIFVPCHRVVSTSGALASHPGGVERKRWLLRHERVLDVADLTMARALRARRHARLDPRDTVALIEWSRVVGY